MTQQNLISAFGILVILALAWLMSSNRRQMPGGSSAGGWDCRSAWRSSCCARRGARWSSTRRGWWSPHPELHGRGHGLPVRQPLPHRRNLVQYIDGGAEQGFIQVTNSVSGELVPLGTVFAIHILPTVIFFSSLMAIFYHLGVMQRLIKGMAWIMQRTMKTSGSESLSCAANIFVGQTEAPW